MTDKSVATLMYKSKSSYLLLLCVILPHLPLRHLGFCCTIIQHMKLSTYETMDAITYRISASLLVRKLFPDVSFQLAQDCTYQIALSG